VVVALALTGWVSARLGGAALRPAVVRNVGGGALAMAVTYGIGSLVGLAV
jgi:VIT1/CCC1 family predicted Fe2+/Mn2+ transporter